ncbi:MAG: DNA translocase FtsK 4TM domain-containing protein [Bacteroidales bacterium]|nr:DNA translocase FtsK 4TM domain-containing protein [Bacteroidales bacterium]MBQ9722293.1 DNA translocase FtsK 4TM domain-containing protein [Bacteroidales bacterium]
MKRFFTDMDPDKKSTILKYTGIAVLVFTFFTLLSTLSYLFTWQADQSLMSHPEMMGKEVDVANWGGKLGYRWSRFLVSDCFGLGSFALVFLMGAVAYRLFFWNRHIGLLRTTFVTVSGTFLSSLILAFASVKLGPDTAFGGGLGGDAGHAVVVWLSNLTGDPVTVLVLAVLVVAWLILSNGRFARWFASVGIKEEDPADETPQEPEHEDLTPEDLEPLERQDEGTEVLPEEEPFEELPMKPVVPAEPVVVPPAVDVPEPVAEEPAQSDMEVIMGGDFTEKVTEELPRIDNREELERFKFPPLDLLKDYAEGQHKVSQQELDINNNRIRATLQNYRIEVDRVTAVVGPTVTLYKVVPSAGVRVSAIENLHREIAMALGASGVRVVTLPDCVGIEVPNNTPSIVPLKSMLNDDSFRNSKAELPIAIGYTITQEVKTFDLTDAPHLLIAGATKQGKSVGLNVIISSLLYAKHPTELKFVFIDPKMVEFTAYNALLKHYLAVLPMAASEEDERENAIIKQPKQAEAVLNSLCIEMDERYKLLAAAGVNDIKLYNDKYKDRRLLPTEGHKFLPYLVVVIDEYADLTMTGGANPDARKCAKNISDSIVRLAQKGRAAGLHVIIATQRPSVNVITGLIKTNFPTRIAFRVVSGVDSRTILDSYGAENLIGRGDMLYYAGVEMERVQCALVSMAEINKITKFIGDQTGYKQCCSTPYYLPVPESQDGETSGGTIDMQNIDPLFEDAARMIVTSQRGSTSDLQRRLGMGYARAGRVMDQLEGAGIVGPQEGSKPRQVLVTTFDELDEILSHFVK